MMSKGLLLKGAFGANDDVAISGFMHAAMQREKD
jgi:hypothetical protein